MQLRFFVKWSSPPPPSLPPPGGVAGDGPAWLLVDQAHAAGVDARGSLRGCINFANTFDPQPPRSLIKFNISTSEERGNVTISVEGAGGKT